MIFIVSALAISAHFLAITVSGQYGENTTSVFLPTLDTTEICSAACTDVCVACDVGANCTMDERDCDPPPLDPFQGICPPQRICIPKEFNCK